MNVSVSAIRRIVALAMAFAVSACHTVELTQRIPASAAQELFQSAHTGPIVTHYETGHEVRITPSSQLRLVYQSPAGPARTALVSADALRASPTGLTVPGAPTIEWQRLDAVEVRHVDVPRTLLWFLAGAAILAGCTYYDCYGQVPR
jgi:hypothetical protein